MPAYTIPARIPDTYCTFTLFVTGDSDSDARQQGNLAALQLQESGVHVELGEPLPLTIRDLD